MNHREVIKLLEANIQLSELQKIILVESWKNKKYQEIAQKTTYDFDYIKEVGSQLWRILSETLGEKVTKKTFRSKLEKLPADNLNSDFNHQDWADVPDLPFFYGRTQELNTLKQWIVADKCRLVAIVGLAGVGKTQLSVKLGKGDIGKTDLSLKLAQGIQEEFDYVIWRRLLNAPPISNILGELIRFISNYQEVAFPELLEQQINLLIGYLRKYRCLLILDNAETILQDDSKAGQYLQGYEGYGQLLNTIAQTEHQSCLLITSREKPQNLCHLASNNQGVKILELGGLNCLEGREIFNTIGDFIATEQEWSRLIDFYNGNPLALELAACHIQEVFFGNIADFIQQGLPLFDDLRGLLDWHFQRLSELEQEVMYWLAINRDPISFSELQQDILTTQAKKNLANTLQSLQRKIPLEITNKKFTLQPVLMEYVIELIITQISKEIIQGEVNQIDLFALLKASAKDYIRESQARVIIKPILERAIYSLGSQLNLEQKLKYLLHTFQHYSGYTAGNILNLLCHLQTDLRDYYFSGLIIRQAYLIGAKIAGVNFAHAEFVQSCFTQAFGGIHAVVFSPSGQLLAVGDSLGDIHLLRVEDGQIIASFGRHKWWAVSLAFSADSQKLVSSSLDSEVKLWHINSRECLFTLKEHKSWIWTVTFSPNSQLIITGSDDQTIKIWDANNGKCLKTLEGHSSWVLSVAHHPTQPLIVSGSHDRTIKLWDINNGECLKTLGGSEDAIWSVSFSPDGQMIVSTGYDGKVRLWSTETGECLKILLGHNKEVKVAAFSLDGQVVASGSFDLSLKLWDVQTGQCRKTLLGHLTGIRALAFSPDAKTLVSTDNDQTIKFWDIKSGKCLRTWQGYTNWVWAIAINQDDRLITSGHLDHKVRLWDSQTGQLLLELVGHRAWIWAVAFSPKGKILASSSDDETIRLWDIVTGQCLQVLQFVTQRRQGGTWTIAFSPDGKLLASAGQDVTIKLWDINSGKLYRQLDGYQGWVWSLAFSPRGQIIAAGCDDQKISLWSLRTGKWIKSLQGHTDKIKSVAFSPDGQYLISGSEDTTLKLWNIDTGECLTTLEGHHGWIWSVAYSSNGHYGISGSVDHTVKLWCLHTRKCLQTLTGHTDGVRSVAFSHDSQTIISGSADGTIKLWSVGTGQCYKTIQVPKPYEGVNITGVKGLSAAMMNVLRNLGAVENFMAS